MANITRYAPFEMSGLRDTRFRGSFRPAQLSKAASHRLFYWRKIRPTSNPEPP
jgi:hypothetical protein